jgi:secondary thiamine-phosphate synthase enzyme
MLEQHLSTLTVQSPGRGLVEITAEVRATLALSGIRDGLLTLFLRHTSASLVIQENADPDVRADLDRFFARLVRDGDALFQHRVVEGM